MKPTPSPPSDADIKPDDLLKQFRAYLHLVITAKQTGQGKELKALPGPNMLLYCRVLADMPDINLAGELSAPVTAILDQISHVSHLCENTLRRKDGKAVEMHAAAKRILEQLDLSVGFILRSLNTHLWFRGEVTKDTGFSCGVLVAETKAGGRIARMVRRYQQL